MIFPPLYTLVTVKDSVPWVYTSRETAQAACDYFNAQKSEHLPKWTVIQVLINQYERPANAKV